MTDDEYKELLTTIPDVKRITSLPFMEILSLEEKILCLKELADENSCKNDPKKENEYLFDPKDEYSKVYFISKGLIKLSGETIKEKKQKTSSSQKKRRNKSENDDMPFALLSVGDMLGELELFEDEKYNPVCTAKAVLTDVEGTSIDKEVFKSLLKKVPSIYMWMFKHLATKIIRQGIEWNSQDHYFRLLYILSVICKNPAFQREKHVVFEAQKKEFGDIVGTYTKKITWMLKELEEKLNNIDEGTISIDDSSIVIYKPNNVIGKWKQVDKSNFSQRYIIG